MIWLYRILFLPGLLISAPYYLYRMRKRGGYRTDWKHRFGFLPVLPKKRPGVCRLWIQAVSVGEIQAIEPLLQSWHSRDDIEVFLTSTTSTGYRLARERWAGRLLGLGIFPLDFWPVSALAWSRVQPDCILLMESEIWPEHIHRAGKRRCPAVLINARLSDRSYQRYQSLSPAAWQLLGRLDCILAATEQDARRFLTLCPDHRKIHLSGSLKLDVDIQPVLNTGQIRELREELGFQTPDGAEPPLVLLGSSTWPGEEAFLLKLLGKLRDRGRDCRLLLVPRHAERGDAIAALLKDQSESWHRRSSGPWAPAGTCIYLADTTGELRRLTQVADLAFIGKSLPPHTMGQTPIECAALGIPIVAGPGMSNFRDLMASLEAEGGCRRGRDPAEVKQHLLDLLQDPEARSVLSTNARNWLNKNRGALQRTRETLQAILNLPRE